MTTPLRRSLLNTEISFEARHIAHAATQTCRGEPIPNSDDHHTPNCNELKRKIETLCLQVKCAALQPPQQREPEYPPDHPAPGDLGSLPL
jgi:hypothetical protein